MCSTEVNKQATVEIENFKKTLKMLLNQMKNFQEE